MSADCIFCKIASGEIPVDLVYENEQVVAFHDINPQAPRHLLVIPREHIENVAALTREDAEVMMALVLGANAVATELGFAESGYRLVMNVGEDGGQTVPHLHIHLLGGRELTWPPG